MPSSIVMLIVTLFIGTGKMTYSCDSDDGFKEPYYDFDSEVSVAGSAKRTKVGSTKPRPKSACSVRGRGDGQAATIRCHSALGLR